MEFLIDGVMALTWQQVVMYAVGVLLIWLAIKKEYEPSLLLPMGFGAILVNLPASGVLDQVLQGGIESHGIIAWLFEVGIDASEAMPVLLFIGIGAMIDFGPLLSNPVMFLFGAGAQFGIFAAILLAALLGFDLKDAASIGIIGAADGPTSILVSQVLKSNYIGPICGGRVFVHGSGSDYPACGNQTGYHKERTSDSYGIQSEECQPSDAYCVPDRCYHHRRTGCANFRSAGWFPDVR